MYPTFICYFLFATLSTFVFNLAEDTGIEPDSISQASRLAGGPYHQIGLSSINFAINSL